MVLRHSASCGHSEVVFFFQDTAIGAGSQLVKPHAFVQLVGAGAATARGQEAMAPLLVPMV